jgi:hypothetical protein
VLLWFCLIFSKLEVFHKVVGSVPLGFEVAVGCVVAVGSVVVVGFAVGSVVGSVVE